MTNRTRIWNAIYLIDTEQWEINELWPSKSILSFQKHTSCFHSVLSALYSKVDSSTMKIFDFIATVIINLECGGQLRSFS